MASPKRGFTKIEYVFTPNTSSLLAFYGWDGGDNAHMYSMIYVGVLVVNFNEITGDVGNWEINHTFCIHRCIDSSWLF